MNAKHFFVQQAHNFYVKKIFRKNILQLILTITNYFFDNVNKISRIRNQYREESTN